MSNLDGKIVPENVYNILVHIMNDKERKLRSYYKRKNRIYHELEDTEQRLTSILNEFKDNESVILFWESEKKKRREAYYKNKERILAQQKSYYNNNRSKTGIKIRKRTVNLVKVKRYEANLSYYSIVLKDGETRPMARRRVWNKLLKENNHLQCSLCGNDNNFVIDHHHFDSSKKTVTIGDLLRLNPTKERLDIILKETVPLCSNCHRIHHYSNDHFTFSNGDVFYG